MPVPGFGRQRFLKEGPLTGAFCWVKGSLPAKNLLLLPPAFSGVTCTLCKRWGRPLVSHPAPALQTELGCMRCLEEFFCPLFYRMLTPPQSFYCGLFKQSRSFRHIYMFEKEHSKDRSKNIKTFSFMKPDLLALICSALTFNVIIFPAGGNHPY